MKQKLARGVRKVLPDAATQRLERAYRGGRVRMMRIRYGNPADGTRIIAVTGRSGKSTTACLLTGLLVEAGHSVASFDPSAHGDSVSALWRGLATARKQQAEFIIIEVSPALVQSNAFQALTLDTVVVTNPCEEARVLLAQQVEYAVIPRNNEFGELAIAEHQIVSFGEDPVADAKIESVKLYRKGTEVKLILDHHTPVDVATFLVGRANVTNIAAAVSAAYVLGVPLDTVQEGVARCEGMNGNFEYVESSGPFTTVVDRATNADSARQVVASAKELAKRRLVVAVDIKGLSNELFEELQQSVDRLIVVSSDRSLPKSIELVDDAGEARAIANRAAKKDDTVLLLGKSFIINT